MNLVRLGDTVINLDLVTDASYIPNRGVQVTFAAPGLNNYEKPFARQIFFEGERAESLWRYLIKRGMSTDLTPQE
ncbi:MAG: hypothetical protein ACLFVO_23395 [Chloroflexaceae bacterium]